MFSFILMSNITTNEVNLQARMRENYYRKTILL